MEAILAGTAFQAAVAAVEAERPALQILSNMGVVHSGLQRALREKVVAAVAPLEELIGDAPFLGGDAPSAEDKAAFAAASPLFVLLLPEGDASVPRTSRWWQGCAEATSAGVRRIGTLREGGMVDLRPQPVPAATAAVAAIKHNAALKKGASQRDKEKAAKEPKPAAPAPPPPPAASMIGARVARDAPKAERMAACLDALAGLQLTQPPRTVEHAKAATMEEMQAAMGGEGGALCKNLFLKAKKPSRTISPDTKLWLVSALSETQVSTKKLSKHLGYAKEIRMARDDVLDATLALNKGECSPFGLLNDREKKVQVIVDAAAMEKDFLWFHPLTNEASTCITPADLLTFIAATGRTARIVDFTAI